MPASRTVTHPNKDYTLTFTEEDHRYVDSTGMIYVSGTTLVKDSFPKFDDKAISEKVAEKRGEPVETILAEWDEAGVYGTRVHETAEATLLNQPFPHRPRHEKERRAFNVAWQSAKRLMSSWQVVAVEQIVFSPELLVAGTIDLLMYDPATATYWILDWKTNKKITTEGYKGETARGYLSHLPNCKLSAYSLQLSLYERILRREGYIAKDAKVDRALIHIPHMATEPVWYSCQGLQLEVSEMLLNWVMNDMSTLPF